MQEKGIPPLGWDLRLQKHAKAWAKKLAADGCKLYHSKGSGWGENLAASFGYGGKPKSPREVVGWWVAEEKNYDYKTNTCDPGEVCGHYTQVVWKNSKYIGCARAKCTGEKQGYIYGCNYDPPGNFRGQKPY